MKATILGTDLLQHGDSVKILEINTNAAIYNVGAEFLDYDALFNVLTSNNIDEFHFIYTEDKSVAPRPNQNIFEDKIKEKCTELGITYTPHVVPQGSVTVPAIEDADNKFILRQAYDTSALVDSTYCADKFEFFSLMSGSSYIPKTYFSSSDDELLVDTFDSLDINDSDYPNLVEKSRYPAYDREHLPSLAKFSDNTEFTTTKTELSENHLIQEFINDSSNVVDGYWSVIRSIDIIYGSNLDTINLGGYTHSSLVPLDFCENTYEDSTEIFDKKTRYKFLNKNATSDVRTLIYHTDEESDILMFDDTISNVSNIQSDDVIKTTQFDFVVGGFGDEDDPRTSYTTVELISSSLSYVSSSLISSESQEVNDFFIQITLDNGEVWTDTPITSYVIEDVNSIDTTRFEFVNKLLVGDKIITINKDTNNVSRKEITALDIVWDVKKIYNLDFEPYDYFMVDVNNGEYAIMHNACNYCSSWAPCGSYWCDPNCPPCLGGGMCFTAGTEISLSNGDTKNIEDIQVGDEVVTYNENTKQLQNGIVGDLTKHEADSVIRLTLDNENIIITTEEHPFYVVDTGWVIAGELKPLDVCLKIDGSESIVSTVELLNESHTVYNLLDVSDTHNFFANGILVHNKKQY